MCEASSKIDSTSALWGEIQVKHNPSDTTNLWKPNQEYQNIAVRQKRKIDEQISYRNKNALASENENLRYDQVGLHIIKLQEYHHQLTEHLHAKQEEAERQKKLSGKEEISPKKRKSGKRNFLIPNVPTQNSASQDKCQIIVNCRGGLSKSQVTEQRILFLKNVLAQTGFCVKDTQSEKVPLDYLSDILDNFLQKFVRRLYHNKSSSPFAEEEDLWNPLETTLRDFGIGGTSALHTFYYENIIKKRDTLLDECTNLYTQLKNFDSMH